jgi:transposase
MRKVREVLRLVLSEEMSRRRAARALGMPYTTVVGYVDRAQAAGLTWPLPAGMDDRQLEDQLFRRQEVPVPEQRAVPNWAFVHKELRRKGVTLMLLWEEHKAQCPDGYQYTQFVHYYRQWAGRLDAVMRHNHRAGEKTFLDFAGPTIPITDPRTGDVWQAQLFVAVLGASSYTYAEATVSQELPHWVAAHARACEFFGGTSEIWVPDNLKSAVTKAHRYEPELNRTYREMAAHYGCAIIPARGYKPRDKAKAEAGVLLAERWILACLRNRKFFSLAEANLAIWELLERLNSKPFQKLEGSRRSVFEELERIALRPLPERPYEFATWKKLKVSIDYHLDVKRHYYSVPHQYIRELCEVRLTATTVEVFLRGRRIASHVRSFVVGGHTTVAEHMPESHRRHSEWSPQRLVRWAATSGPQTALLFDRIMQSRAHPEQGFRSCLGIMRLDKRYPGGRLEAACARAVAINALTYRSVESILKRGLDRQPLPVPPPTLTTSPSSHDNVRGPGYYQ